MWHKYWPYLLSFTFVVGSVLGSYFAPDFAVYVVAGAVVILAVSLTVYLLGSAIDLSRKPRGGKNG